jgi:hypothetical protein
MERERTYISVNIWISSMFPIPYSMPDGSLSLIAEYCDTLPANIKTLTKYYESITEVSRKRKVAE